MTRTRLGLWAMLLAAFALRAYRLGFQSVWTDEGFAIGLASRSLGELIQVWNIAPQEAYASLSVPGLDLVGLAAETDIHPPLYYFLLHFWLPLAGRSEFSIRFLSLFFGVLTVPLIFALGRRLVGEKAAVLAAFIAALSPFYVDYSQQARMYTLVTFLVVLSMYSFYRAFQDEHRAHWPIYALSTALALYTHYFALMVTLAQAVLVVVGMASGRGRGRLSLWLASQAGAVVLLALWLPFALRQVLDYQNRSLLSPDWQTVLPRTWQAFNLGLSVDGERLAPALWGLAAFLVAGLLLTCWNRTVPWRSLAHLLLYLALPFLAALALLRFKPMFHPKYFMVLTPAYYLLLAAALYGLWRLRRWASLPLGLFLLGALPYSLYGYYYDPRYWKDDTRALVADLVRRATPADLVLFDLMEPFGYYYRGPAPAYYLPGDESTAPQRLASIAAGRERVFLVHYEHSYTDAQGLIPFLLEKEGEGLREQGFRGYTLREYRLRPGANFALAPVLSGPSASFEDKLTLEGWQVGAEGSGEPSTPPVVPSGGQLWAILAWRLEAPAGADYKAVLYLADGRGHVAAHSDRFLLRGMGTTSRWLPGEGARNYYILPLFPGVPPGQYSLRLRVYGTLWSQQPQESPPRLRYLGEELDLGPVMVSTPLRTVEFRPQDMGTPGLVQLGPLEGLGYTLTNRQYRAGETVPLTLFLRSAQTLKQDYRFRFELRDSQGFPRWQWESSPLYPTSRWRKGDGVRDWQDLYVPRWLPPGEYRLWMGVMPPANGPADLPWDLGTVSVLERPRLFAPPPISRPLRAELEGKVALLGYDLEGSPQAGRAWRLTLYWQALAEMEESYTVFTHLVDGQKRIWAQHDGIPGADSPTSGWVRGEVVVDRHTLALREDAPPGEYVLEVGMYQATNLRRLPVLRADVESVDNALWLTRVRVP